MDFSPEKQIVSHTENDPRQYRYGEGYGVERSAISRFRQWQEIFPSRNHPETLWRQDSLLSVWDVWNCFHKSRVSWAYTNSWICNTAPPHRLMAAQTQPCLLHKLCDIHCCLYGVVFLTDYEFVLSKRYGPYGHIIGSVILWQNFFWRSAVIIFWSHFIIIWLLVIPFHGFIYIARSTTFSY